jgi:hypothetical protein
MDVFAPWRSRRFRRCASFEQDLNEIPRAEIERAIWRQKAGRYETEIDLTPPAESDAERLTRDVSTRSDPRAGPPTPVAPSGIRCWGAQCPQAWRGTVATDVGRFGPGGKAAVTRQLSLPGRSRRKPAHPPAWIRGSRAGPSPPSLPSKRAHRFRSQPAVAGPGRLRSAAARPDQAAPAGGSDRRPGHAPPSCAAHDPHSRRGR